MRSRVVAVLVALAAVVVALVVVLPASAAGNAGTTQVATFDPTGAVFTCPGTDYTVLGGNFNAVNGKYVFTDTEFFNILGPSGGVVAKVAAVEQMSSGGSNFTFTFGECEPPQD